MSLKAAILISAHNDRQKAIACLEECMRQIDTLAAEGKYSFSIYFMDDASTDGVLEAVQEQFPKVISSRSTSHLHINGALRSLWSEAAKEKPDFYIWIDSRIVLKDKAILTLLENSTFLSHNAIIAGSVADADGNIIRGGRTKKGKIKEPDPVIPVPTFTFDGNIALIPSSAYDVIGMTSSNRKDFLGDWEYGLKAFRNDVPRVIAPGILATGDGLKGNGSSQKLRFIYDLASNGPLFAVRNFFEMLFKSVFTSKELN